MNLEFFCKRFANVLEINACGNLLCVLLDKLGRVDTRFVLSTLKIIFVLLRMA